MKLGWILLAATFAVCPAGATDTASWADRWVWIFGFDLEKPAEVNRIERILADGAAHGLNGVVLSAGLDWLPGKSKAFSKGLDRVMETCRKHRLELIPAVFSFGYGGPFLSRNRNLAEGMPVKDALFIAGDDGFARLAGDPAVAIKNGGFEENNGDRFPGYGFQDTPGTISFADTKVFRTGRCSLRLENFASDQWGHGRINQKIKVQPYRSYRITLWVKTKGLRPKGGFRMIALAPVEGERELLIREFDVPATTDWRRITAVLNSREFDSVRVYCGVWGGKKGKVWVDDWKIEELGPQHALRRPGTPVTIRSDDGKTTYREGRDFAPLADPNMNLWQLETPAPDLKLLTAGRIKPGARLRVSWYHPVMIYRSQVGACMAEPEIYRIAEQGVKALVERLRPKKVLLNMDEIRTAGTCAACGGKDMAKLVGGSVARIAGMFRELEPDIKVYVWSDMFDPHHNARPHFYHVQGDYTGSWKHLPKDLIMALWGGKANKKSFDFFAHEGFHTLGACCYLTADLAQVKDWIRLGRSHPRVRGFMYTTWARKYDLLPAFCDLLK